MSEIEIRQSLSQYDLVNRDNTLCMIPQQWADQAGLEKGDEVRIWSKENGAIRHFQIYRIAKNDFDQDDNRIRMSLNGRQRMYSLYDNDTSSGWGKLLEDDENAWNASGGPEEKNIWKAWSNYSDNGNTVNKLKNVPDEFQSRIQFIKNEGFPQIVNIRPVLADWDSLTGWRERCAISKALADEYGFQLGDQIFLRFSDRWKRGAPYTIYKIYDTNDITGEDSFTVRLAKEGRERLNQHEHDKGISKREDVPENLPAHLWPRNPSNKWRNKDEALKQGKSRSYNILETKSQSNIIVTSPHSGGIEVNTFDVCEKLVDLLNCDWWNFSAHQYGGGTFDRWHITSADMNTGFQELSKIKNNDWEHCISVHGYEGKVEGDPLLIGGRGPKALKEHITWYLDKYLPNERSYDIAISLGPDEWSNYNGYRTDNFVNYLTKNGEGGIQYELPRVCRDNHFNEVAKATARAMKTWMNPHKPTKQKKREVEP